MSWGKKSKSYVFQEQREEKSVKGLSYTKKQKPKVVKIAHTNRNRSMEQNNRELESSREFCKVYRAIEPPKTINAK